MTADCVIFALDGSSLKVLLIERGNEPYKGRWAFPGGFMNMDESAKECALRELQEETGLVNVAVEQFHAFSTVGRDPRERIVTVSYTGLIRIEKAAVVGGDDAAKAQWFSLEDVPDLAFDHERMLRLAKRFMKRACYFQQKGIGCLPEGFTEKEIRMIDTALGSVEIMQ